MIRLRREGLQGLLLLLSGDNQPWFPRHKRFYLWERMANQIPGLNAERIQVVQAQKVPQKAHLKIQTRLRKALNCVQRNEVKVSWSVVVLNKIGVSIYRIPSNLKS